MPTKTVAKSALEEVRSLYKERDKRAKELREQGQKVIGYFCCYAPLELMTAVDLVPYRILGNLSAPTVDADKSIETTMCPYIRSCFEMGLHGGYDHLDGIVFPHSCDNVHRLYNFWKYYIQREQPGEPYAHFVDVPHVVHPSADTFFKRDLARFRKSLEGYTGRQITDEKLRGAIRLHNENRALVRRLYEFRKSDPPLISGAEVTQTIVAGMSVPVQEFNDLLRRLIVELPGRTDGPQKQAARLLVYGGELDDTAFMDVIEGCGANVVMDDLCIGTRHFWDDVEETLDPLDGLVERYLNKLVCPRTYKGYPETREKDLDFRFEYLVKYAREFNVNGVVLYVLNFCDIQELDVPDIRDYLQDKGYPVLCLQDDYTMAAVGQVKTRVQAFVEMIR